MLTLSPDQVDYLIRQLLLLALVAGFLGAVLWDGIKAVCIGFVARVGMLIDRHRRVHGVRERAAALAAAQPASQALDDA